MAPAVRVNNRPHPPVLLVGAGSFGERCCEILSLIIPGSLIAPLSSLQKSIPQSGSILVLALWRVHADLCEQVDAQAFTTGFPWLPVVMDQGTIWVGPMVVPSSGPCFRCFRRRRTQHDTQAHVTETIEKAYERDPFSGPTGFLPHHARLAASLTADMIAELTERRPDTGSDVPGKVMTIAPRTCSVTAARVVACHDCDRCQLTARIQMRSGLTDLLGMDAVL